MRQPIAAFAFCMGMYGLVQSAAAATVNEGDLGDGGYSGAFDAPTVLDPGVTGVTGSGTAKNYDFFVFTGLPAGAQTITLTFEIPDWADKTYSGGGILRASLDPFGKKLGGEIKDTFRTTFNHSIVTLSFDLDKSFTGTLYMGLYFTHGADLQYNVSTDASYEDAPVVPLPGAGILKLTGLAGAGALQWRRRRS
jgi:hypothetical protein